MKLNDLISTNREPENVESAKGNLFLNIFNSITGSKAPISLDGYMKKADKDDYVMFSESPRATSWAQISIRKVRTLEYFGREFIPDGVCAKVRLTL
jgi:hypothetical protein